MNSTNVDSIMKELDTLFPGSYAEVQKIINKKKPSIESIEHKKYLLRNSLKVLLNVVLYSSPLQWFVYIPFVQGLQDSPSVFKAIVFLLWGLVLVLVNIVFLIKVVVFIFTSILAMMEYLRPMERQDHYRSMDTRTHHPATFQMAWEYAKKSIKD